MERTFFSSALGRQVPLWSFLGLFVVGTWPTLIGLSDRWLQFDESYSHGFLVLLVSLVLCAGTWRRVRPAASFYWPWLIPLVLSVLLYIAGSILLIEAFQQVALIPLLLSGLMALWGWKQTLPFVVPVGLMALTLPFWDYLSWPLQLITVSVNQFMLSWLDIEFVVEGVFVYFPGVGAFEIAHGCSGLRYLLVGATLSLLYGELNLQKWSSRVWLLLAGVLFALVANWVRVFIIIYVGYESDMTSSLINEHDFFGWWVFAATLVPLFFIGRWLEAREDVTATESNLDRQRDKQSTKSTNRGSAIGQLFVIVPVLVLVVVTWFGTPSESQILTRKNDVIEEYNTTFVHTDEWLPLFDRSLANWRPEIARPDRVLEKSYAKRGTFGEGVGAGEVLLVALYSYDFQRPGREVIQYGNRLHDSAAQLPVRTFEVGAGGSVSLAGLTLQYRRSDEVIYLAYGYYVEGQWEQNELQAKLAQLPGILNSRTDASLLVIGLQCGGCDGEEKLQEIVPEIRRSVQTYLDQRYGGG
jgi:exosortase